MEGNGLIQILQNHNTNLGNVRKKNYTVLYLSVTAKAVHVVQDGNKTFLASLMLDVCGDFNFANHQIHEMGSQLYSQNIRPRRIFTEQRRTSIHLPFQVRHVFTRQEVV